MVVLLLILFFNQRRGIILFPYVGARVIKRFGAFLLFNTEQPLLDGTQTREALKESRWRFRILALEKSMKLECYSEGNQVIITLTH